MFYFKNSFKSNLMRSFPPLSRYGDWAWWLSTQAEDDLSVLVTTDGSVLLSSTK